MKVKLSATIPVVQYGNIIPEIEVEGATYEEAMSQAEYYIKNFWNKYVEQGKELPDISTNTRKLLNAYIGGQIYYDDSTHTYTNKAGEKYLSGSVYAEQFRKPFDAQKMANIMAKRSQTSGKDIQHMWELKSQVSRDFGSSIHAALQLYEQFRALAERLGKTTHLHDHPIIKHAVESFYNAHKNEQALSEVLVVNHTAKHAGQIDRLLIVDKENQLCRIQDFKTGTTVKDISSYWKQLEFYQEIVKVAGWTVQGLDIFHYDGDWHTYTQKA